ncbi:hypothetical protein LJR225_000710 [Phenylobacterium sp. LjRoot225]|uniref:hypothetical protein n=1 Tax=Phenylobacterium sp. LjRoot225 TaxID=3342285 RepID=UPI003ED09222
MSFVQLRTVPGLFIGRRQVVQAASVQANPGETSYRCGACDEVILTAVDGSDLSDVVVKCHCGEHNQT